MNNFWDRMVCNYICQGHPSNNFSSSSLRATQHFGICWSHDQAWETLQCHLFLSQMLHHNAQVHIRPRVLQRIKIPIQYVNKECWKKSLFEILFSRFSCSTSFKTSILLSITPTIPLKLCMVQTRCLKIFGHLSIEHP